jgi:cell division transport system permease protein
MRGWLRNHMQAARDAGRALGTAPLSSALAIVALATALALPLALFTLLQATATIGTGFALKPTLSVYLKPQASAKDREGVERALRALPATASVKLVTRESALADLAAVEGMRDLLAGLNGNPLPDTLVVTPRELDRASVAALTAEARKLPGVDSVEADVAWVERLDAIVLAGVWGCGWLGVLLAVAVVAATFNTVRLQVLTRAREIEVGGLFGGTRAWLRRPFVYFGALQGLLAGGLAVVAVAAGLALFARRLGPALVAVGLPPVAPRLDLILAAVTLIAAGALGWLGAWLAVGRHIASARTRE